MATYDDMAVSPLGIPLLAGPRTISTAMNFVGQGTAFFNTILIIIVFAFAFAQSTFLRCLSSVGELQKN
jgi:small neutral amino acid transporter SnatA (MarC family)